MLKRLSALAIVAAVGMAMPALAQNNTGPKKEQPKAQTPSSDQSTKPDAITLKVGDKAPELSVEEWVKGDKVSKFDAGKVYVVEFWATWCVPCKASIPHLTEVQKEYKSKNVTVIGVAGSEDGDKSIKPEDRLPHLKTFVKEKADAMGYTVAYDADRSMSNAWMKPAGQKSIPCAFVVGKDGKIAWIGHPTHGLDDAVKKALNADKSAMIDATPTITTTSWQQGEKQDSKKKDTVKADAESGSTTLAMGDKAPELSVEEWVKGDQVKGFEKGKIYVVEFWATWCGPCIASIPHLTEVQKEYKDKNVTVIGVASSERGAKDKRLEKVKSFVDDKGDEMGYRVAYDHDQSMSKSWMEPAGQNGIPCAFIVNGDGKVAWIGHPSNMEEPLKQIVAGKWDLAAEAAKAKQAAEADAKAQSMIEDFQTAMQAGDQDKAMGIADKLIALDPAKFGGLAGTKFKLMGEKDNDKAYAWARTAVDGPIKDNAEALNAIAWQIVDPDDSTFTKKDLDLALKAATQADNASKHKDPAIIDTLAKVTHDKGDLTKAIELQEKAVKLIGEAPENQRDSMEQDLKDRLQAYKDEAKKKGA